MNIRLRTTYAGPTVTAVSGSIVNLPDKEAKELIERGYAEPVKTKEVTKPASNADGDSEVKFIYKNVEYTKEQLLELAQKAELPANVSNPNTIVKRLVELDFDPDAGGNGDQK